jgi:hypothetical protein
MPNPGVENNPHPPVEYWSTLFERKNTVLLEEEKKEENRRKEERQKRRGNLKLKWYNNCKTGKIKS